MYNGNGKASLSYYIKKRGRGNQYIITEYKDSGEKPYQRGHSFSRDRTPMLNLIPRGEGTIRMNLPTAMNTHPKKGMNRNEGAIE